LHHNKTIGDRDMKITNITWETDGIEQEELSLPSEVELPEDIDADDDDAINDYLSDIYGWLVIDWILSDKK
jgi:hypothetical protein